MFYVTYGTLIGEIIAVLSLLLMIVLPIVARRQGRFWPVWIIIGILPLANLIGAVALLTPPRKAASSAS